MRNKRRKNNRKELVKSQVEFSGWGYLPRELLEDIFQRLDYKDLFWVVSSVCRWWQFVCWNTLFSKDCALDLMDLRDFCDSDEVAQKNDQMGIALMKVLKSIFNRDGEFEDIYKSFYMMVLPHDSPSDKHLIYIAKRTSKLQNVLVMNMDLITGKGFSRAIRNWKQLIGMSIAPPDPRHFTHIIHEIGINCRYLKTLVIYPSSFVGNKFILDEYNSFVMADSLHSLVKLHIVRSDIYKLGLKTIMSKCKQLRHLSLRGCFRALDTQVLRKPLVTMPDPVSTCLKKSENSEWFIDTLPGMHDIMSTINYLWKVDGDPEARQQEVISED